LTRLEKLDLGSNNELKAVPACFTSLTALRQLDVSDCKELDKGSLQCLNDLPGLTILSNLCVARHTACQH
jgi:hypothetical protein